MLSHIDRGTLCLGVTADGRIDYVMAWSFPDADTVFYEICVGNGLKWLEHRADQFAGRKFWALHKRGVVRKHTILPQHR